MNKSKIGNFLLIIALILLLFSCGSVKKKQHEKEIHYELVTTLRDSLVITHEIKETVTERVVERVEDKKEKADNYKRTDKDGTIHEYYNYSTEVKTDEKTIENVKELQHAINILQTNNRELTERLDASEKETDKIREQLDIFRLIIQVVGAILFIYLLYLGYRKLKRD